MKLKYFWIHAFVFEIILNVLPFFYTDVFYNNQTYIGNTLHHPIYLFLWTASSVFGFYYYSKMYWDIKNYPYSKILHLCIHVGMFLSIIFPYSDDIFLWSNDLHVWVAGICIIAFICEWIYVSLYSIFKYTKECIVFYVLLGFSIFLMLVFGHITSICEIFFTLSLNMYLYQITKKESD